MPPSPVPPPHPCGRDEQAGARVHEQNSGVVRTAPVLAVGLRSCGVHHGDLGHGAENEERREKREERAAAEPA